MNSRFPIIFDHITMQKLNSQRFGIYLESRRVYNDIHNYRFVLPRNTNLRLTNVVFGISSKMVYVLYIQITKFYNSWFKPRVTWGCIQHRTGINMTSLMIGQKLICIRSVPHTFILFQSEECQTWKRLMILISIKTRAIECRNNDMRLWNWQRIVLSN